MSKPKFSKYWPPGIGALMAFIAGFIPLLLVANFIENKKVNRAVLIALAIIAIGLEIWQYRRRKRFIESGECLPSHPLIKTAYVFNAIALILFIISINAMLNIFHSYGDCWALTNTIGIAWSVFTFSLLAVIYSIFAFIRSAKDKQTSKFNAIIPFAIGLFFIWINLTFIFPIINGMNEDLIESWHNSKLETIDK